MPSAGNEFHECRECACSALRRAARDATRHYEKCFRGTGMKPTQFTILATLAQTGPITLSKLARMLGLERTTLNRCLRPLEKKNWLQSLSVDKDQRLRQLKLTPKGRSAAAGALHEWRHAQSTVGKVLANAGVRLMPEVKWK